MSKLRKMLAVLGILLVSSMVFSACSDDDFPKHKMGAVAINSCVTTSTTCAIYWTLVPNDNCGGYKITLYTGTRSSLGNVVEEKTFDNRTGGYTFTNLTPSTSYVIKTQGIPGTTGGFTDADEYYKEFTTAAK